MLKHLSIRNFAIVAAQDLDFQPGFTALTGETGAGKSILIDALALALGERAAPDLVRPGGDRVEIAAEFSIEALPALKNWLLDQALDGESESLLLRRVVDNTGRSRAFINGHVATLSQLREAGEYLVDVHGQHAHQSLLRGDAQRRLLDEHAGLSGQADAVTQAYREWQRLVRIRMDNESQLAQRQSEHEQLAWQVEELEKLAPADGEWELIDAEYSRLAHAASLLQGARQVSEQLAESDNNPVCDLIAESTSTLRNLVAYDKSLEEPLGLLEIGRAHV